MSNGTHLVWLVTVGEACHVYEDINPIIESFKLTYHKLGPVKATRVAPGNWEFVHNAEVVGKAALVPIQTGVEHF